MKKPSRITFSLRHTGRFYIGLSPEDFAALYGMVLLVEGSQILTGPVSPVRRRIIQSFKSYAENVRSKTEVTSVFPSTGNIPHA